MRAGGRTRCNPNENTLVSIPAKARAVYAPRENPKMHILSPYWSIQIIWVMARSRPEQGRHHVQFCIRNSYPAGGGGTGLYQANKGDSHTLTLRVKRQAPSDRQIQDFGKPTVDGIHDPWSVTRGKGSNTRLALKHQPNGAMTQPMLRT